MAYARHCLHELNLPVRVCLSIMIGYGRGIYVVFLIKAVREE